LVNRSTSIPKHCKWAVRSWSYSIASAVKCESPSTSMASFTRGA
jgi:hypothetical protein